MVAVALILAAVLEKMETLALMAVLTQEMMQHLDLMVVVPVAKAAVAKAAVAMVAVEVAAVEVAANSLAYHQFLETLIETFCFYESYIL
jgi:hypothetical protein